jgi:hypothetical protein
MLPAGLAISDVDEVITRLVERLHPSVDVLGRPGRTSAGH